MYPVNDIQSQGGPRRIWCYEIGSNDSVFCCWDATTTLSGVVALSQRRGRRGVLASQSEGRVTPGYSKIGGKGMLFPYA